MCICATADVGFCNKQASTNWTDMANNLGKPVVHMVGVQGEAL